MKSRILTRIIVITLFAALAITVRVRLSAQEQAPQEHKKLSGYTVIDLGTLGGPNSFVQEELQAINNRGIVAGSTNRIIPHPLRRPGAPHIPHLPRRAEPSRLPELASDKVVQVQCPPEAKALGAVCGNVPVPLDRKHPKYATIQINFELYQHSGSVLESAILVNFGSPGVGTTTFYRNFALGVYGSNLDAHDLVLIDDRGRGLSGTINCDELQHGTAPTWDQAVADCAAQLGQAASWYGTGDIAQDVEAVRAALGYDKVDYHGGSYGGADVSAYATRFGDHLRSIVLDAPLATPGLGDAFVWDRYRTHAEPGMVSRVCERSPTCSADHPAPRVELDELIRTVRHRPVEGNAYDANGDLMHVRVDEDTLLNYVIDNPTGIFTSTGEILAAADSLRRGDPKPLLRLDAEGYFPTLGDSGDPTVFSLGARIATVCVDQTQPYDWSSPLPERTEEFRDAVSDLPLRYFAPFSKMVGTGLLFTYHRDCLDWEKPTPSSPIAEPNATYPFTPTLVLTGDLDNLVPTAEVSKVVALFPNSTQVSVTEAGHETLFWTQCAVNLASGFIETLQVGDTSCTKTPETIWPAVGRFPLIAADAHPAEVDPGGENHIGRRERMVVTVAVATATDALQRAILSIFVGGTGNGVGLRAGTFQTDFGNTEITTTLTNCAFAEDVTVNGTVTWNPSPNIFFGQGNVGTLVAELTVGGSGTAGGTLHVEGTWLAPGPVGNFKVSGTLGGQQVAVLVPEA